MISLPYLSAHKLSGADAGAFLHAQLSADIISLADGQSSFAAYCSPRGQVIALLLVCRLGTEWLLMGETSLATVVVSRLQKYVLRARVRFEPVDGSAPAGLTETEVSRVAAPIFKPLNGTLSYVLATSAVASGDELALWRRQEILNGVAWLRPETSERFLPQMLGLDNIGAVSFSKGCYPGQEIIARTRYLGNLKRRPVLLELDAEPPLGPGDACVLNSEGRAIEGVAVEVACAENAGTTLLAVAPLQNEDSVSSLKVDGIAYAAHRVQIPAG